MYVWYLGHLFKAKVLDLSELKKKVLNSFKKIWNLGPILEQNIYKKKEDKRQKKKPAASLGKETKVNHD